MGGWGRGLFKAADRDEGSWARFLPEFLGYKGAQINRKEAKETAGDSTVGRMGDSSGGEVLPTRASRVEFPAPTRSEKQGVAAQTRNPSSGEAQIGESSGEGGVMSSLPNQTSEFHVGRKTLSQN